MESSFLPALPSRLISRWPILLAAALAGALAGLGFSWVVPPVYQAEASTTIGIDYSRILPLELIVEDRVLDRVRELILSDEAIEATWERLQDGVDAGAYASPEDLRRAIRLDQWLVRWRFVAFDRDPARAARVANTWHEVSFELLEEARRHAERVQGLQGHLGLVQCVALFPEGASEDAYWQCVVKAEPLSEEALAALQDEVRASRGLVGAMVFAPARSAKPPEDPVLWGRGLLVLAGTVFGTVAAAFMTSVGPRQRPPLGP